MRLIYMITICLMLVACNGHRDFTEYRLDEGSFNGEAKLKIEQESGVILPDGSKGLAFYHLPPIDPIVFAKIKIPSDTKGFIANPIGALKFNRPSFPKDFASDRCEWWPPPPENVVLSQQTFNNGYYVELFLVNEGHDVILYIKYFTI